MSISPQIIHLLCLGGIAFVVTYFCVPLAKRIAFKFNAIDYPSARRVNKTPMPRMGGIAMFMGVMAALVFELVGEVVFDWHELYRSARFLQVNYVGVLAGLTV
ncbi:MAG TPA: undecaprenyl/decaprenyl-phosphate alpha-N-acetylglucosaminyl 1-phosphate transferase, partial [Slackia equolifaciens]|nr:undecaprenyl/decaprenyl-phosphate alpha-N-acetylglucosaminyl 1-phosphate transferase [Slackia equolifaciens]